MVIDADISLCRSIFFFERFNFRIIWQRIPGTTVWYLSHFVFLYLTLLIHAGWLGAPSGIGWGVQSPGRSSVLSCYSSRQVLLGGVQREDLGHAGRTMSLSWAGNTMVRGFGSLHLCLDCCLWLKMGRWMNRWNTCWVIIDVVLKKMLFKVSLLYSSFLVFSEAFL